MKISFTFNIMVGVVLLILLSLPLYSASLGTYKQYSCVNIKTILNTTSVNISSISYPNSTIAIRNQEMTKVASTFNYTFCNTSDLGIYVYDYYDTISGEPYVNDFEVTATGQGLSIAKATSYFVIFIISFIIFIGLLLIGIYLPSGNKRDELTGYILAVSNIKYLKMFCLCLAYLVALFISFFSYSVSYSYLDMPFITNIFWFLFLGETVLLFPLFAVGTYIVIANMVRDNKIGDMLSRGLSTRGDDVR